MLSEWFVEIFRSWGVDRGMSDKMASGALVLCTVVGAYLFYWLIRNFLLAMIRKLTAKTSNTWDDMLMEEHFFHRVLAMLPLTFMLLTLQRNMEDEYTFFKRILFAMIVLYGARAFGALVNSISNVYHATASASRKPIRPLFQSVLIVVYSITGIAIISILLNKSPWNLFGLMGGLTAVTMLVFKDTILGFVAGIQLGANDMVREGDWIEMPKYSADGDVIEVAVNTVKVRNWDKTITTIPTYALTAESFKNWRGMSESGGRRIKRSICIDMNTVQFADKAMLEKFQTMELLKDYVQKKQEDINTANSERGIDLSATVVNGRRQTNLGIFRAYLQEYLRDNPNIHKGMTFLVRHLQPTPQGLPIEIYVFSSDKVWANYEGIQADIFDHILASVPEFGLRVYQQPSGNDLAALGKGV